MYQILSTWGFKVPRKTVHTYIHTDKTLKFVDADEECRFVGDTLHLPIIKEHSSYGRSPEIFMDVDDVLELARICSAENDVARKLIAAFDQLNQFALDWDLGASLSEFVTSMHNEADEISSPSLWHSWIQQHEKALHSNGHFNFFFRLNSQHEVTEIEDIITTKVPKYTVEGTKEYRDFTDMVKKYSGSSKSEDEVYKESVKEIRNQILKELNSKYPEYNGNLGYEYKQRILKSRTKRNDKEYGKGK